MPSANSERISRVRSSSRCAVSGCLTSSIASAAGRAFEPLLGGGRGGGGGGGLAVRRALGHLRVACRGFRLDARGGRDLRGLRGVRGAGCLPGFFLDHRPGVLELV